MEERKADRLKEIKRRKRGRELTEREASGRTERQRRQRDKEWKYVCFIW